MNKILISSTISLALILGACSENKNAEQFLASADENIQQGKIARAIIDYKNAVRLSPKNANARLALGKAYLAHGDYLSAEKELERTVQLGTNFEATATMLAEVKTRLNKYTEVDKLVKASDNLEDNDYLIIITYAGIAALADGQTTKAQDYFSQAVAMGEDKNFAKLAQSYLLYLERQLPEALSLVNGIVNKNKKFFEALRLKANLLAANKDYNEAGQAFQQYISSFPEDYHIQFFLVNTLIKAEKFEQASEVNTKLLKRFKKSPLALQHKAQIEYNAKNYEEARNFANQAIAIENGSLISKMIAGISSYKLNEFEQAYDYLIGLEGLIPATHPVNVILLSVKIKLGHTDDLANSVARLNDLKNSDSDSNLLEITSMELMKIGDYASAQALLNKAGQVTPNNAQIKVRQGVLLLSQGDLSGIKSLEQALTIDPSLHETEFALARQYIQGDETSKAQAIATKWLTSEDYVADGYVLSGMIATKNDDITNAESFFNKALDIDENNISALYSLASVYLFKNQTDKAVSGLEKVITLSPNHHDAILKYGILQTKTENSAAAISFLSTLNDQHQLNNRIHKNLIIGLALNLRAVGENAAAIELLEAIKGEKNLPIRYWVVLVNSYKSDQKNEKAIHNYEEAIKARPYAYILRVGYIQLLQTLNSNEKALTISRQADNDFPGDTNLMTTLAHLELTNRNVQAAKKLVLLLKAKNASNPLMVSTEAGVAMAEKEYEQAIRLYRGIYEQQRNGLNAINLARGLQFSLQHDEAEQLLEKYLKQNKDDFQVRTLLAELYEQNNIESSKSDQLIAIYKEIVKAEPNNITALNNLAWQEYQSSDLDNAQKHIEQALSISPEHLALQESYGVILVANKQHNTAINVLTEVQKKGSVDVNAKVALAEAYVETKQSEKAKAVLEGLSAHDSKLNTKIVKLKLAVK